MPTKLTTDTFVNKASQIHYLCGYDYTGVMYVNNSTPVRIICPLHGEFYQRPANHLRGTKCPACADIGRRNLRRNNIARFIEKSNQIHNRKYNYSKSIYGKNNLVKLIIICPIHGEFKQSPNEHLDGCGCPKCGHIRTAELKTKTTADFIKYAKLIWGNLYDYSNSNYIGCDRKVRIICKIHGEFEQTPSNHTNCKQGCPKCNFSKGEAKILFFLEKNKIGYKHQHWFPDCRSDIGKKQVLKFDFFIPSKNLLIEYNGRQHYNSDSLIRGQHKISEKEFADIRRRDKIKKTYASLNNIKLLVIKYTKINQIEKILVKTFDNNN